MKQLTVKFNVDRLLRELSALTNKDYDKQSLAVQIGISRSSLYNILDNSNNRVDLSTLGKLLYFFHSEGLVISMSDLFVVTNEPKENIPTWFYLQLIVSRCVIVICPTAETLFVWLETS